MEKVNSPQKTARIAGLLYLALALLGAFGLVYVPSVTIAPGDIATTASNVLGSESLFRLGFVSNIVAFTINIFLALFLYELLKPVHKGAASLMVILILMGLAIGILNELNQFAALSLLSSPDYLAEFNRDQLNTLAAFFLDLHEHGLFIAHMFWGLWLLPMGYLVFKSVFLPRLIGALLLIAGFGYLADFTLVFLFPQFDVTVSEFTFVGEVLLLLWLLIKGVNVEQWEKRALGSA